MVKNNPKKRKKFSIEKFSDYPFGFLLYLVLKKIVDTKKVEHAIYYFLHDFLDYFTPKFIAFFTRNF